jgi:hypothetical protein
LFVDEPDDGLDEEINQDAANAEEGTHLEGVSAHSKEGREEWDKKRRQANQDGRPNLRQDQPPDGRVQRFHRIFLGSAARRIGRVMRFSIQQVG